MGRAGNQTPIICGAGRACAVAVGGASGRCYSTPGSSAGGRSARTSQGLSMSGAIRLPPGGNGSDRHLCVRSCGRRPPGVGSRSFAALRRWPAHPPGAPAPHRPSGRIVKVNDRLVSLHRDHYAPAGVDRQGKVGNAVLAEAADHGDVANDDPTPVILTLATTFAVAVIPARTPASP